MDILDANVPDGMIDKATEKVDIVALEEEMKGYREKYSEGAAPTMEEMRKIVLYFRNVRVKNHSAAGTAKKQTARKNRSIKTDPVAQAKLMEELRKL